MWKSLPWLALVVLLGGACVSRGPHLEKAGVDIDGWRRLYYYHVPEQVDPASPAPLVVALHGAGETPRILARRTRFMEVADREGFIIVFPRAHWRQFNVFRDMRRDDVAYIRAVVEDLRSRYAIDPVRTFLTGISNGGFMAYRTAVEASDLFAAVAPVLALMPRNLAEQRPEYPVSMCIINATGDRVIRYDATTVYRSPWYHRPVLTAERSVAWWVDVNGCRPEPVAEALPHLDPKDPTQTSRRAYTGGKLGTEVVFYTVRGGGHLWPGGNMRLLPVIAGPLSRDLNATEVIWDFFQRHPRPEGAVPPPPAPE